MRRTTQFLGVGLLVVACMASGADEKKSEPVPGVTLILTTVESKDDRKLIFQCVLKNTSDKPVVVADGYDGKAVRLLGIGMGHRSELCLLPMTPKKVGSVTVKSGEERTVFELPADDILFNIISGDVEEGKQVWRWNWLSHLYTPPTPFHESSTRRLLQRADFWAEVELGGRPTVTKKVPLKLRLQLVVELAGDDK